MPILKLENIILKSLKVGSNSGYGLMKEMKERTGWKPSAGSMYPALKKLMIRRLISVKPVGRGKMYSLTALGKREISKIEKQGSEVLDRMKKQHRVLSKVYGMGMTEKDMDVADQYLDDVKEGKLPFGIATEDTMKMKKILFDIYKRGKIEGNEKKIKKIIADANKELRKIK
jgi:DNA-binding PadR family transcriptional regulator